MRAAGRVREEMVRPKDDAPAARFPVADTGAPPMFRAAGMGRVNGNGGSAPGMDLAEAAGRMCGDCGWRPKDVPAPAWAVIEAEATATCEACVKRAGYALPAVCAQCPGVALLKALAGQGETVDGA